MDSSLEGPAIIALPDNIRFKLKKDRSVTIAISHVLLAMDPVNLIV